MKRYGKKKIAAFFLLIFGAIGALLKLLGEQLFESAYNKYLASWLDSKLYFIVSTELDKKNREIQKVISNETHTLDILICVFVILLLILGLIWIVGKYYSAIRATKTAQEKLLLNAMKALVDDEAYIQSAQVYRYDIVSDHSGTIRGNRIIIDYIGSEYTHGMDINAVVHEEFFISEKTLRMVKSFSKQLDKYESTKLVIDREKAEKTVDRYINQKRNYFKNLQFVKQEDCLDYIIYKGIQSALGREKLDEEIEGMDEAVTSSLLNGRRTGCIPAILLQSVYVFRNGQSNFKKDRAYWSFSPSKNFLPKGYKNILLVLTIPYNHIEERDDSFLNDDLVKTVNSFLEDYVVKEEAENNAKNK